MVMCSPADIRVYANPASLTDTEIASIVAGVTSDVLTKAGSTDETDTNLIQAVKHGSAAITLKRARAKGELASSVKTPESEISITGIIEEIKQHEEECAGFIQAYKAALYGSLFSSPSCYLGFESHCHGGP